MTQPFTRDRFTWLAYLLLALYGYFLNILGPITPFLKDEMGLSYTISSLHFTAFAVGILLVGVGGHLVIERLGRWRSLWVGAAGISLSALVLLAGRTPVITIGAAFLMGLVGSLILAVVPSALSDRHGDLRVVAISEANVISSMLSTTAPLMVGLAASVAGSWRLALGLAALAPLLLGLSFGKTASPPSAAPAREVSPTRAALPGRYWLFWVALVLVVATEFCMIFWSADFLENELGMPKAAAAQAVSLFLAAMIVGRLASSRLVQRFSAQKLVSGSILLAGAGFLLYWQSGSPFLGSAGLFITGLGVACLYPLILSLAIASAPHATDQASARGTLASGTAILILPLVLGGLADAVGIRPAYGVVALLLAGAFLVFQFAGRISPAPAPMPE